MPKNITPIFLPSRAPELNPVENIWHYMRANWLSNRVFETYDAICSATMKLRVLIKIVALQPSSTRLARHGESSSLNPQQSPQSGCETGRTSVNPNDRWYKK
jgi:hypothetical protein